MDRMSKPTALQTGKLRAYLAKLGVPPNTASELVKMAKTRKEISDDIIKYIRGRGRELIQSQVS